MSYYNDVIIWLNENYSGVVDKLTFLADEFNPDTDDFHAQMALSSNIARIDNCRKCAADGGKLAGTNKCPEALLAINIKSSNYYKKLVFSETECKWFAKYNRIQGFDDMLENSGIPAAYKEKSFKNLNAENYSVKEAKDICVKYCENFPKTVSRGIGMYIWGESPGIGKTHLAVATAIKLYQKWGVKVLYKNSMSLVNEYLSAVGSHVVNPVFVLDEAAMHPGILVLDDFSEEKKTEKMGEIFYYIVNTRYDELLPTIFTSNRSLTTIEVAYGRQDGMRIADRIKGRCKIIHVNSKESFRDREMEV